MDSVMVSAAGILFREGLEAVLVIMALAAYMVRSGHGAKVSVLWGGAAGGVALSLGGAWVVTTYYGGEQSPLVEGLTMAAAAAVMLYVSGWMFVRQDPAVWKALLERHMAKVLGTGSLAALAGVAALAVFREGAETVLMLNALAVQGGMVGMWEGVALGAVILAGVFYGMQRFAVRLPLRWLFAGTSAFLCVMGLHLAMEAVGEFQEIALLPATSVGWGDWTLEAIGVMGVVALSAVIGALWARRSILSA